MDIWQLRVFLSVAAERSFSWAAEKLHRTQPAISQAFRQLEMELGQNLFDRKTGTLTPAGALLQQRGGQLLQLFQDTEAACAAGRTEARPSPAPEIMCGRRRRGPPPERGAAQTCRALASVAARAPDGLAVTSGRSISCDRPAGGRPPRASLLGDT